MYVCTCITPGANPLLRESFALSVSKYQTAPTRKNYRIDFFTLVDY